MKTITFVLTEQMLATSVALPLEQLRAAESMAWAARQCHRGDVRFLMASLDGLPVKTNTGLVLTPDCALEEIDQSHLTYLPALWRNPKNVLRKNHAIGPWLLKQHRQNGIIAGVGTGCCFMAETGLLNYRPATTHWYYFDQFSADYPLVKLERNHFITGADNLYCAASVNALADLTVFFIQEMFGTYYARHVEQHFFHEVRKAYTLPYDLKGGIQAHPDEDIARIQSWIRHNFAQAISVQSLAKSVNMSLRTFNRRFKKATHQTPLKYMQTIKMQAAGELLQTSNLSIADIADKIGYQDLSHFTEIFKNHFATTPSQYRTTVRAKLFTPDSE